MIIMENIKDMINVEAGIGATVGKARGTLSMMKSGLGMYALQYCNEKNKTEE